MRQKLMVALVLLFAVSAFAVAPVNGKLAVKGYDVVAYFDDGKAVEGSASHEVQWNGATWRFASAATKAKFVAAPETYAPQYGGYCAWAVSRNYTADADPQAWKIVDGKLYLNYNAKVQSAWSEDVPGNITKADANWPKLLEKSGD
jgi:YHS domain-containing protein